MQKKLPTINSAHGSETRNIINEIIKAINDRGLEILSESGFLTWLEKNGIKHREEVQSFSDLPSNDSLNTVRGVFDDNKIYIKKENGWVPFQTIDISKINYVEDRLTSQLTDIIQVDVKNFKIEGQSDWTQAIKNAVNYANELHSDLSNKPTILFPYNHNGYPVTDTIYIPHGIHIKMDSPLFYKADDGKTILSIGDEANISYNENYVLQVMREIRSWTNGGVGIELFNCNNSKIDIIESSNNTTGCIFRGETKGFAYNSINLNLFNNNKKHLHLIADNGGWVNENNFFGGRFANGSNNNDLSRHAIILESITGRINANIFYKPSFEIGVFSNANVDTTPVIINPGRNNKFYDCRFESSGNVLARIEGDSFQNDFTYTYSPAVVSIKDNSTTRMENYLSSSTLQEQRRTVYDSGDWSKYVYPVKRTGNYSEFNLGDFMDGRNLNISKLDDISPYTSMSTSLYPEVNKDNSVTFKDNAHFGLHITSVLGKNFRVFIEGSVNENSQTLGTHVIPFDANGNVLSPSNVSTNGGFIQNNLYYLGLTPVFGGKLFKVSSSVKSFFIAVRSSLPSMTTISKVRIEQVITDNETQNNVVERLIRKNNFTDAIYVKGVPDSGSWTKGQQAFELEPIVGGHSSYICLKSGTFGTATEPTFGKFGLIEN